MELSVFTFINCHPESEEIDDFLVKFVDLANKVSLFSERTTHHGFNKLMKS